MTYSKQQNLQTTLFQAILIHKTFSMMLIGGLGVSFSSIARADDEIKLKSTEIISHYENAISTSNAASQGAVTASLINNRPTLRTGEILEFVPGMIVSQHSGDGKANQYYLRGFNLDHGTDFATFVDDIPVNMRSHAHGQGYTDLNFLIPELVNRIDYKKGPYYADEGDFSSAGAAHIRLANKLPQGLVSISTGENDYQRGVIANSKDTLRGTWLYGLELNYNNGPWQNDAQVKKYNGVLRYSEGGAIEGMTITAMAYHNQWNATDQIPLRAVQSGLVNRFGAIDPTDGGKSSRYSLSYGWHKNNQDGAFELNAYAVQSSLDLYSNFTYFLNNPIDGDQFSQSERRQMYGFNLSKVWYSNIAGVDMQNKIGLQTRYDDISPVSLYNTASRQRTSLIRTDQVKELSAGFYAENSTQWLDKLRSVSGMRYDAYHFDVQNNLQVNSGHVNDGVLSPKLSLVFGPWDNTEYFLNYGRGFHSNDARGTTQNRLANGDATIPVTPLVATYGKEIGVRTEFIQGLQSSLALWQLDIASELVFVGDAGETEPSRASRRQGVEWSNHYIANDWLLLDFDLAASRARYRDNDPVGNYIPGSIDKVASMGATVTHFGNWYGAFQLRHFGSRPLVDDNSVRSSATSIAYARVGYQVDKRTKLALDVFNLFDSQDSDIDYFYQSRLKGEAVDGVGDIHFHPVEPRTARLTLQYYF